MASFFVREAPDIASVAFFDPPAIISVRPSRALFEIPRAAFDNGDGSRRPRLPGKLFRDISAS